MIVQFVSTFALWILATRLGLSPILTLLFFAMTVARRAPKRMNAHLRLQTNAVWEVAIFVLNELTHVVQQAKSGLRLPQRKTPDEEIDEDLKKQVGVEHTSARPE